MIAVTNRVKNIQHRTIKNGKTTTSNRKNKNGKMGEKTEVVKKRTQKRQIRQKGICEKRSFSALFSLASTKNYYSRLKSQMYAKATILTLLRSYYPEPSFIMVCADFRELKNKQQLTTRNWSVSNGERKK